MSEPNPISSTGLEKLKADWETLFRETRPKLVEEIAAAAAQGDRSENAEYIYGKRRLREIYKELRLLDGKIGNSVVVEGGSRKNDKIYFGARIKLLKPDGREWEVHIVGKDEIDPLAGKISMDSPMGKSLMGHIPDGKIEIPTPKGPVFYEILEVSYP
jgi:transcription elongation factor GreB